MDIAYLLIGLLLGSAGGIWLAVQARSALADAARESARREEFHVDRANRQAEREALLREHIARVEAAAATDDQMLDAFRSLSQEALAAQSAQLVQLAEAKYGALHQTTDSVLAGHSKAVGDGLRALSERLVALERERNDATSALRAIVGDLSVAHRATQAETSKLAAAMRDNRVRGAWGEVQLRRVLEMAGLDRHADFIEQRGVTDGESRSRPDVVVPLPNGRCVVIDAKVPLDRYLDAANAGDPAIERRLQAEHAKAVAGHVTALAQRDYAAKVDGSVDMVLLFLPGEPFLAAALDADPTLFEAAAAKGVTSSRRRRSSRCSVASRWAGESTRPSAPPPRSSNSASSCTSASPSSPSTSPPSAASSIEPSTRSTAPSARSTSVSCRRRASCPSTVPARLAPSPMSSRCPPSRDPSACWS